MIRLREEFLDHPKFADLSPDAIVLWLGALGYCRLHQTDGWVPERVATKLARGTKKAALVLGELIVPPKSSPHLRPLLERCEGGYRMVGYLDHNESKEEIDANRRGKAEAGALGGRASGESRAKQSASSDRSSRGRSDPIHTDPIHTDPDPEERARTRDPGGIAPPGEDPDAYPGSPHVTPQLELVPAAAPPPKADQVREVFDAYLAGWRSKVGRGVEPILTDKRRQLIRTRLKDHPLEVLLAAASGIWRSAWHVENRQTSIELALRDASKIERFANELPPVPVAEPGRPIGVFAANPGKSLEQLIAEGLYPATPPPPTRTPEEHAAAMRAESDRKFNNPSPVGPDARPFPQDFLDPEDQDWGDK